MPISRRHFIKNTSLALAGLSLGTTTSCKTSRLSQANWEPKANLPFQLQEIYCAALNGKIHTAGGFLVDDGQVSVSTHHLAYDPRQDQWSEMGQLPAARHHLQMVAHGDQLYGFAGFEMPSRDRMWVMHQQTWLYDSPSKNWILRKPAPEKHAETVAASMGERIHIVGGRTPSGSANAAYRDHQDTNHHLAYYPGSDSWEKAAPAPTARNSAAGAAIDGLLYVVGGRTVGGGNLPNLEIYDPQEDKWQTAAPMPEAQGGLAAAAVKGKLYAFGGEYFNNGGGVYPQTWCYDPKKDQWTTLGPMLTPRHGLAGVAMENTIYAIAGAKKASLEETSNILEALRL